MVYHWPSMASRPPPSNFIPGFTYFVAYFSILRILVFLAFRFQNLRQGKGVTLSSLTHSGFFYFFCFFLEYVCVCQFKLHVLFFASNSMELRLNQLFTRPSHEAHYKHVLTDTVLRHVQKPNCTVANTHFLHTKNHSHT